MNAKMLSAVLLLAASAPVFAADTSDDRRESTAANADAQTSARAPDAAKPCSCACHRGHVATQG
jgi:hypothetical protein